jgi:hypothetical protein
MLMIGDATRSGVVGRIKNDDFDPYEPDLHTRLRIIEERQQRQALAMQFMAKKIDDLETEVKKLRRKIDHD